MLEPKSLSASASSQRLLPLRVQLRLPMLDVGAVRAALAVNEDDVIQLIDDGALAWAWDISTKSAQKREVRVLARCVHDYQDLAGRATKGGNAELSFDQVVGIVFPAQAAGRPWLWGREVVHALNCGSEHVFNLLREGSLALLPGHVIPNGRPAPNSQPSTLNQIGWRRGPGGMPCVAYGSAVDFLKTRRIA